MPLYLFLQPSADTQIAIWKNGEESESDLNFVSNKLSDRDLNRLSEIKHSKKRLEFLSARAAFNKLGFSPSELQFSEKGKPFIQGGWVSLSHNHTYGAAIVSQNAEVGIDVESLNRNVDHIRHKFISPEDEAVAAEYGNLFVWIAKECGYKLYGRKEIDFKKQLKVLKNERGQLFVRIIGPDTEKLVNLYFIKGEHSILSWCIDSEDLKV